MVAIVWLVEEIKTKCRLNRAATSDAANLHALSYYTLNASRPHDLFGEVLSVAVLSLHELATLLYDVVLNHR